MKIRYPVIGIIAVLISATIWQNIIGHDKFEEKWEVITVILVLALLGLIAYCVAKVIFNELFDLTENIQWHFEHKAQRKEQQACMIDNINKELDEIEATLDIISEAENSDGKITPIWNSRPPKR